MGTPIEPKHLFFLDIETTGLKEWNSVWEIACIAPDGSVFREAWVPDLREASLEALALTHMVDRYQAGELWEGEKSHWLREEKVLKAFIEFLEPFGKPRIMAGASVHFDKGFLTVAHADIEDLFSHRILDVPTFVAPLVDGYASEGLGGAGKALGLKKDPELAHDALYDAWYTRCVYERAVELRCELLKTKAGLPDSWVFYNTYDEALEKNKRLFTND